MIVYGRIVLFFISLLGLQFISGVIILCYYFEMVCFSVIDVWENVCLCKSVCMCCSLLNVCVCEREIDREREREGEIGCVVSWLGAQLPVHISPLPVFIIVPVCSGVPSPLHPFIQMEDREQEMKRRRRRRKRAFSLRGKKNK